jgi:hypothetical protein
MILARGIQSQHQLRRKLPFFTRRCLSHQEELYIDKWFESIVKEESFYEEHADSNPRRYFYNVDLQGRLFLGALPAAAATE